MIKQPTRLIETSIAQITVERRFRRHMGDIDALVEASVNSACSSLSSSRPPASSLPDTAVWKSASASASSTFSAASLRTPWTGNVPEDQPAKRVNRD